MNKKKIRHFLILRRKEDISVVCLEAGQSEIIYFSGEKVTWYDEKFWSRFYEYTALESSWKVDLCLIYDIPLQDLPKFHPCAAEDSLWNRKAIRNALEKLSLDYGYQLVSEDGHVIAEKTSDFPCRESYRLTVVSPRSLSYPQPVPESMAAEMAVSDERDIQSQDLAIESELPDIPDCLENISEMAYYFKQRLLEDDERKQK